MNSVLQNKKFRLRVTYKKSGVAAWLSQLELARALEHAVRRSGLKYAVSQGYSPHMRISFGPAIGVGIESLSQYFDVILTDYLAPEKCLAALKDASVPCLEPISCEYVDNNASMLLDKLAKYEVLIDAQIKKLKVPKSITIDKKGKSKTINVGDYLCGEVKVSNSQVKAMLKFSLKSDERGSLNPSIFVDEICRESGLSDFVIINFKKL